MQTNAPYKSAIAVIVAVCCVSLLAAANAVGDVDSQGTTQNIRQPASAPLSAIGETPLKHDANVAPAGCDGDCCGDSCCSGGSCGKCSCCTKAICCPKCVTEEVKKHCWLVKPKMICIPRFQFNLFSHHSAKADVCCGDGCTCEACCQRPAPCGRVRCINVLEKHEYKCEECGYEWEIKCVRTGNTRSCCKGCSCPSCGKGCGQGVGE